MDTLIGFSLGLLRYLAFNAIFYAIGAGLIKLVTLGRYPKIMPLRGGHWGRQMQDADLVALLGLLATIALLVIAVRLFG